MSMAVAMHLVVLRLLGGTLDAKLPSWFAALQDSDGCGGELTYSALFVL
jgi:hypothetical protein